MSRSGRSGGDSTQPAAPGAPAAGPGGAVLLVVGDGHLSTFALAGPEAVIGRGDDCEVRLDHPKLSRRHARLVLGAVATIEDLGSTNGTRVGGELRKGGGPVALDPDEGFRIGPFLFVVVGRAAADERSITGHDRLRVDDPTPARTSALVRDLARSGVNVLILGETGVGKEVLATTLHELSGRDGPLTRINCAALNEALLESELFGHEKGAFTGAAAQKIGLLEAAGAGTVFLDEIGELPLPLQAKLLRAVEHREVTRLGSTRPVPIDVRFIAATNRDLPAEVEAGAFRRDLFFRLDGVTLVIPPLRERRGLIAPLALRFLEDARVRAGKPNVSLAPDALAAIAEHPWPGNVRELKAVIDRAVLLARGDVIGARHLAFTRAPDGAPAAPSAPPLTSVAAATPPAAAAAPAGAPSDLTPEQLADRDRVLRALDECAGNQTRAAKLLGISRTTLVGKLRLYRIARPRV